MPTLPHLDLSRARWNMTEQQIRPWDVHAPAILDLLQRVEREHFVPAAHRALAYIDMELPLGNGQCMLAPRVQARLVQDLAIAPTDKVLEIGTGSGYTTALLAMLASSVVSLEIDDRLAQLARQNLQRAGVFNAQVQVADALANDCAACASLAPWDAILVSGSLAQLPEALLNLLAPGGRLMAIVGDEPVMRATLVVRKDAQQFITTQPWDTVATRLVNAVQPSRFAF